MSIMDQARVMWRESRERAAERKAARAAAAVSHHDSRFWLLSVPALATILAAIVEWYWAILFCIEATGRLEWNWETAAGNSPGAESVNLWDFSFSAHIPVLFGLMCATAPIIMWSMVWLPVQFKARGSGRVRRGSMIATGILANILVIVSGTVVMNYNRQDQVRASLVVEQSADASRAAIGARLQVAQAELARITDPSMTTNEARAARAGVAGWQTYIRESRSDASVPAADRQRIVRAMGSAEAADALRQRIEDLTVQQATAEPAAATAAVVQDDVGAGMNTFAQYAGVYRPPFVALLCTLVGIFGVWWWIALKERLDAGMPIARSDGVFIEDHSGEAKAQPAEQDARDVAEAMVAAGADPRFAADMARDAAKRDTKKKRVFNPETGQWEVYVQPKGHWRPTGKKQKNPDGSVTEEIARETLDLPDETGVPDGGARAGSVAEDAPATAPIDVEEREADGREDDRADNNSDAYNLVISEIDQSTLQDYTDEERLALLQAAAFSDQPVSDSADATIEQPGDEQAERETALEPPAAVADEYGTGLGVDGRDGVLQGEQHDAHVRARELEDA